MLAVVSPAKKLDTDAVGRSLAYSQPSLMNDIEETEASNKKQCHGIEGYESSSSCIDLDKYL